MVPVTYLEKMHSTPDMRQSSAKAALPWNGVPHCGPVAASNGLIWLARNGFEKLYPFNDLQEVEQGILAKELGEKMKTTYEDGTSIQNFLDGLSNYIKSKGYQSFSLKYQGWEAHSKEFATGISQPQIDWIRRSLIGKSGGWLKVGWYKYNLQKHEYKRFAGHFLTLVGYTKDEGSDVFVVHDSAPRVPPNVTHHFVLLKNIEQGTLIKSDNTRISAIGFKSLSGDLKLKEGADRGILEGAIMLNFER